MKNLSLSASVGPDCPNHAEDVTQIQQALNQMAEKIGLSSPLAEDGVIGTAAQSPTCDAIGMFQEQVLGFKNPDCRIDCGGKTQRAISNTLNADSTPWFFLPKIDPATGLSDKDFQQAASILGCEVAAIQAVASVESSGSGFFESGVPCILFEAHQFSRFTRHRYDDSHPDISAPTWDRSLYLGGEKEYDRLAQAVQLDREAALKSASYGRYQIMGFNHEAAGYADVESFVRDMFMAERHHLIAFVNFIQSDKHLADAITAKDWATFARYYNGPAYAENHYDQKLKAAYDSFCA